jgi:hypothetical protein
MSRPRPEAFELYLRQMPGNAAIASGPLVLIGSYRSSPCVTPSRMGFVRCEIPAPHSSMLLSVRFGTNSAMTPSYPAPLQYSMNWRAAAAGGR